MNDIDIKLHDDLTHVCDLVYYDGPLLSLYKHKINNKLYIYYWYDVLEDYNTFIIFETNKDLLLQFITNKISLKYLIINHIDTAYFVDIYYTKNDIDIYKYRKIDNINKVKDLPGDDSYYDIDAESIWTSNIGEILQNNIFNFS